MPASDVGIAIAIGTMTETITTIIMTIITEDGVFFESVRGGVSCPRFAFWLRLSRGADPGVRYAVSRWFLTYSGAHDVRQAALP